MLMKLIADLSNFMKTNCKCSKRCMKGAVAEGSATEADF